MKSKPKLGALLNNEMEEEEKMNYLSILAFDIG